MYKKDDPLSHYINYSKKCGSCGTFFLFLIPLTLSIPIFNKKAHQTHKSYRMSQKIAYIMNNNAYCVFIWSHWYILLQVLPLAERTSRHLPALLLQQRFQLALGTFTQSMSGTSVKISPWILENGVKRIRWVDPTFLILARTSRPMK